MTGNTLSTRRCAPCNGELQPLDASQLLELYRQLDPSWSIANDRKSLTRRFEFTGFAKAVYLANLCTWLADREGHHPDIAFGWGYCQVTLTTHDIDGLSENDFIWAAQLDGLVGPST